MRQKIHYGIRYYIQHSPKYIHIYIYIYMHGHVNTNRVTDNFLFIYLFTYLLKRKSKLTNQLGCNNRDRNFKMKLTWSTIKVSPYFCFCTFVVFPTSVSSQSNDTLHSSSLVTAFESWTMSHFIYVLSIYFLSCGTRHRLFITKH